MRHGRETGRNRVRAETGGAMLILENCEPAGQLRFVGVAVVLPPLWRRCEAAVQLPPQPRYVGWIS